ncbi:MAG: DEAD/DEAH box helicase, partial [Candidatus Aenigmarchaeota archaeon]|nr:DEAD/DEAH box helicase [Candidatus Aenigmarchaeota archaeon]
MSSQDAVYRDAVSKVLELSGFEKPNPVQELAIKKGLAGNRNMVVAAPTASGKTLIAEIAALDTVRNNRKVMYIVPLKALASEKYEEFREKYEPLGIKVAMSVGDKDSSDTWLAKYDIVISTSEKFDSLMRHGIPWLNQIGLVIADEIHLLDDPSRGPTLEVVLTRMRQSANPRVLALSATISNHEEIAKWLEAVAVKSEWRPVELRRGVCYESKVNFFPKGEIELDQDEASMKALIEQAQEKGKQAIVFISTRRNAESAAGKISEFVGKKLSPGDREGLGKVADRILRVLGHRTIQCERLAGSIRNGVAFHHAGLAAEQRSLVEEAFRSGLIKVITATPTLAAGINLPAWRVIIRDLKRFSGRRGMAFLPILEVEQMSGRAGRPKYDTEGEAILMAGTESDARYAWENYIKGEPERVTSKLGVEPVLRTHVLALISSGVTQSRSGLMDFFSRTFYAHQYGDSAGMAAIIDRIILMMEEFRFIKTSRPAGDSGPFQSAASLGSDIELRPTRIGKRVSELYIDPLTANHFIENLGIAKERQPSHFGYLQLMSNTMEMWPLLAVRKGDLEVINDSLNREEKDLIQRPPNPWDIEYDDYLRSVKTAMM